MLPPLGIKWREPKIFFSQANLCWQEWVCVIFYLIVYWQFNYWLTAHGPNDSGSPGLKKKHNWRALFSPSNVLVIAVHAFLFLFFSTCALSERTQIGAISGPENLTDICRDIGLALQIYFLIKLAVIVQPAIKLNGMLTREQLTKSCLFLVASLGGVALTFLSWLALLALPGAIITVKWISENSKQKSRQETDLEEFLD